MGILAVQVITEAGETKKQSEEIVNTLNQEEKA